MGRYGGPCQAPVEGNDGDICGYEGWSCTWYGKRGHQFCGSHRAAWSNWKSERGQGGDDDEEEPRYLTKMDALLGERYCEPTKMKPDEKFNDVKKTNLQFIVQGTFTAEGYAKGMTDTRWQTLEQLTESCSRESFEKLYKAHLKDLEKTFKRDAKRFETVAQLEDE